MLSAPEAAPACFLTLAAPDNRTCQQQRPALVIRSFLEYNDGKCESRYQRRIRRSLLIPVALYKRGIYALN